MNYKTFTLEEWAAYPKDNFDALIRSWCIIKGYVECVGVGESIPAKLPYHSTADGMIEVDKDFLRLVEKRRGVASVDLWS